MMQNGRISEPDHRGPESLVGGGLLRHYRGFLVGFQARPGGLCPPGAPPLVVICSNNSYLFNKKSP